MITLTLSLSESTMERLSSLATKSEKPVEILAAELLTAEMEDGQTNLLRLEIAKLREDLALVGQAILVTSNEVNEEEARQWVKEHLRHR